jgi:hypothetical protein
LQVTDWRSKTPAGPLWNLKRGINLALDIPAGARRAIDGGFSGSLVGYDLKAMTTPVSGAAEDLVRFAELVVNHPILGACGRPNSSLKRSASVTLAPRKKTPRSMPGPQSSETGP